MSWSDKYKRSIDCDNPQGFSQKAHCAARKKRQKGEKTKSKSPFNEMHEVKSHKTVEQIAKKHRLEVSFIKNQLKMGIPIEHEHTRDKDLATDIALQHLDEIPDYYTRLKKMEADAKKHHKKFKDVKEETKSGDEGLHDWFNKSKSSDGKSGWVQLGGKWAGKPCARQPGQTSTPKCGSSKMAANLSPEEEEKARRRKNRQDPNQPEKTGGAKPTNVRTEEMDLQEVKDKPNKGSGKKDACYHKVKSRYDVWPSAYASGALVKCRKVGAANWGTKSEAVEMIRYCPKCQKDETRDECKYGPKFWEMFSTPPALTSNQMKYDPTRPHPANEEKDHEYSMARSELSTIISAAKRLKKKMKGEGSIEAWVQSKITKAADYIDTAADYLESGEHNVDESVVVQDSTGNDYVEFIDVIKPEPLQPSKGLGSKLSVREETFSNWREELEQLNENPIGLGIKAGLAAGTALAGKMVFDKAKGVANKIEKQNIEKEKQIKQILGNSHELEGEQLDEKCWKGYEKKGMKTMFGKTYPNCIKKEEFSDWRNDLGEDWQSVNRKDKTDGLSQAAVDAYRRENPGSKLQTAVTEKNPKGKRAKRRANFCRRMKGMKSKLTSAKTARDPDSRINKALRRWNCN
jgi:hypothetical protein